MAGKSAVLSVRIITDAKAGKAGLEDYGSGVERLQGRLDKVTPAATVAAGGLIALAVKAGNAASELQQSQGAVESVFKSMASTVDASANAAAGSVGLAATEYNNLAAVIGSQLKNAGTPLDDLAGKTDGLIKLGSDLAATYGGSTQEAVESISSLLRGESDPIEKYGISMNQNAIAAEKLRLGLDGLSGDADKAAQQQAILSLLTQQSADAQGQFARESDTAAGAQQRATAEWANATAQLGTALLPVMSLLAGWLGTLAGLLSEHQQLVLIVAGVIGALALGVLALNGALRLYQAAQVAVTAAQWLWNAAVSANPIGAIILAIIALIAIVVLLASNWDKVTAAISTAWEWLMRVANAAVPGWVRDVFGGGGGTKRVESTNRTFARMAIMATPTIATPTYAAPVAPAAGSSALRSAAPASNVVNNNVTIQAGVADKYGTAKAVQSAVRSTDRATGTTRASGRPRW